MGLNKSKGNMYPWVSKTHSHLRGKCPHGCAYCYTQAHERRWGTGAFAGPVRLKEDELKVKYGNGHTIFIEHQNDLFAEGVPDLMVQAVLAHCNQYPDNVYVFQSKNPARMFDFEQDMPPMRLLGTTLESNREHREMGEAPTPYERVTACRDHRIDFVTIEPVMAFDMEIFTAWLVSMHPKWVNIGADSKGCGLPEPDGKQLVELIRRLDHYGLHVAQKLNLNRLMR